MQAKFSSHFIQYNQAFNPSAAAFLLLSRRTVTGGLPEREAAPGAAAFLPLSRRSVNEGILEQVLAPVADASSEGIREQVLAPVAVVSLPLSRRSVWRG